MKKIALIVLAIVAALVLMIAAAFISANNRAVSAEEQVSSAAADVQVAEKRRVDLVYNLADAVKSYQNYEGDTLTRITQARAAAASGKVEQAQVALNAVAEQYPELKANENYKQLNYEAVDANMVGSIHTQIKDHMIADNNRFYTDAEPQAIVNLAIRQGNIAIILFGVLWIALTGGAVYGFCALENRWLDG